MSEFLPKDVRDALAEANRKRQDKKSRYRIHANGEIYKVRRRWDNGFSLPSDNAPNLRGLVDFYDGAEHLYQCLIVNSAEEDGERQFEFKRATPPHDRPPLDFERGDDAPVALIGKR